MKKTFLYIIPATVLTVILLAAIPYFGPQTVSNGYQVGDTATDFNLKNIDGNMLSMASHKKAKGFIVAFTCNHCPYAKLYEQRLIDLHAKYTDKGYPVIAINPNDPTDYPEDSYENMKKRAAEKGYGFAYLVDETQEIARAYGATKTPHIYLIQKERSELKVKYIGAIDNAPQDGSKATEKYVEDAIDALIAGNEVPKTVTKAIGCSIKWKQD